MHLRLSLAALLALGTALLPAAHAQEAAAPDGDAGAYLAARLAAAESDYLAGSAWFSRAILADPQNPVLLEGAIVSYIGTGEFGLAAGAAKRLADAGGKSQVAHLALIADKAQSGDYEGLLADLSAGRNIGALMDGLSSAWAHLGAGRMSEALSGFDALSSNTGVRAFGLYHKALALASVGDFEGAEHILSGDAAGPVAVTRRGIVARIQVLSQLERDADAIKVLDDTFGPDTDPGLKRLRDRLAAGETIPFDVVRNPVDGFAEVFFSLATALNGEAEDGYTLLYARAAAWLRPDHTEAAILAASLLEAQGQHQLAVDMFATVPAEDPAFFAAEIGRANATYAMGRKEAGVDILQALVRVQPANASAQIALADALRRDERYAEALKAYDAALALPDTAPDRFWSVWFSRGICHERLGDFPAAEADMRKALELSPDQPQVLNYLGYSYVDRGENLDEALDMIQRAVTARPDAGYIIDSLAWALYRLGHYDEALGHMEQASLLEPVDPVVTDHLGDVYWAVGRRLEARFQWQRALSFEPEEKDATRIRRKLEVGLDTVLTEEGAPPLTPAKTAAQTKPAGNGG